MYLIAMKIYGKVVDVRKGLNADERYKSGVRPLAKSKSGFAICDVVLSDGADVIDDSPKPAELNFPNVVELETGLREIDLYDGPNLRMKFFVRSLAHPE